MIWEELLTTSKLVCSTYLNIKAICLLKALHLKYTGENTALHMPGRTAAMIVVNTVHHDFGAITGSHKMVGKVVSTIYGHDQA